MIAYIKNKFPPAPILNIALSVPGEGAQTELTPALIDTGSDFTLLEGPIEQTSILERRPRRF